MPSTEEQAPLLASTDSPQNHRQRRFGTACLFLIFFWQGWGTSQSRSMGLFFRPAAKYINPRDHKTLNGLGICILYILPVLMGLYTDLFAGRYKALSYGLGVKIAGSFLCLILTLVMVRVHNQPEELHKLLPVMAAFYYVGDLLYFLGVLFIGPITITLMIQQYDLKFHQISTLIRWGIYCLILGSQLSNKLKTYIDDHKPDFGTPEFYKTIDYGIMLGCDVLSVAFFLLGRAQYKSATTTEGEKSGREIWRRVKTWLCPSRSREPLVWSFQESASSNVMEKRIQETIDRQKIRKGILFMAIQSTITVSSIAISFFLALGTKFYHNWEPYESLKKIHASSAVASLCVVAILEILFWKVGHRLEPVARQLKFVGVIMCLAAIGVIVGGAIHQSHIGVYWLAPVYTLMYTTVVLLASSALALCYTVSPRGLETFTIYLMINLPLLFFLLQGIIAMAPGDKQVTFLEDLCYIIGGGTLAVIFGIYLPVCRWFLKADATIKELEELRETGAGGEEL